MTTRLFRIATAWIAGALLSVGGAASADPYGEASPPDAWRSPRASVNARGRVMGIKAVRLRGTNQSNAVVMIQTADHRRVLIDLGPRADALMLDLRIGDLLSARGTQTKIRGRSILVAAEARAGDLYVAVDRTEQRRHFQLATQRATPRTRPARREVTRDRCSPE